MVKKARLGCVLWWDAGESERKKGRVIGVRRSIRMWKNTEEKNGVQRVLRPAEVLRVGNLSVARMGFSESSEVKRKAHNGGKKGGCWR